MRMRPKQDQPGSSRQGCKNTKSMVNSQSVNSLANLAQGKGSQHSHALRSSTSEGNMNSVASSHFLPDYMKNQSLSRPQQQYTQKPELSKTSSNNINGIEEPVGGKGEGDGDGDSLQNNTKSPISLDDLMLKLNSLTSAVSKIDSMAKDIDIIAEDIKSIKALQDTTMKLTQDMSEVQGKVENVQGSVRELEEREEEILTNQQMLAKELIDIKSTLQVQGRAEIEARVDFELNKIKADQLKLNLILEGMNEPKVDSAGAAYRQTKSFIKEVLGLRYVGIDMVHRLGKPRGSSAPPRPMFIRFLTLCDRMEVWHSRSRLTDHPDGRFLLKEDLPPPLRPIMAALNRVTTIAKKYPEKYRNVYVRDYNLYIDGKAYDVNQLELLPKDLRPSHTSTPGNVKVVVFFGRESRFSNHFESKFVIGSKTYYTIEQYLALHRARFANRPDLEEKAMASRDPAEAKRVLNQLRGAACQVEWENERKDILFAGLLAKFVQNDDLREYLLSSDDRILGEASKNSAWGIGLTLSDKSRLNPNLWTGGNLQGKTLMEVRRFIRESTNGQQTSNAQNCPDQSVTSRSSQEPTCDQSKTNKIQT